jgi:Xaa-Pro aminopeptidase
MDDYDLDVLIAFQKENITSISGIRSSGFVVFPRDGEVTLVIPTINTCLVAENPSWITDVRCYGEYYVQESLESIAISAPEKEWSRLVNDPVRLRKNFLNLLTDVISRKRNDNNIGIDERGIDYLSLQKVRDKVPGRLIKASSILDDILAVKTDEEIRDIKTAASITEKGLDAAENVIIDGATEREVANAYRDVMLQEKLTEEWGQKLYWGIFGCGTRSAYPQCSPSDYKIKRGDMVMLHGGCTYNNHISDICRVAVCQEASNKQQRYWKALLAGGNSTIEMAKAGIRSSDLFCLAIDRIRTEGIEHYRRHHVGHNLEPQYFQMSKANCTVLENNMVICIETPYYEIGWGGMNCENEVIVQEDGCEPITCQNRDLCVT